MQKTAEIPALTAFHEIRPVLLKRMVIPPSLRSKISIDDVLQEIARTLLRTSTTVQYSDEDWRNAVFAISIRQFRKQLDLVRKELPHSGEHAEQSVSPATPLVELLDFSSRCSERQRRVLTYRLEGYSFRDIGKFEGLEETAIRRLMRDVIVYLEHDCE
jgi:DNA-directed RNA polymerase specialized sigma24 family protein